MKTFNDLWRDLEERTRRLAIPIVQDYKELEHVFNLIQGCHSYLEIGAAEGNSLYVLAQALKDRRGYMRPITIIDYGEKHTAGPRKEVIDKLKVEGITVWEELFNSHNTEAIKRAQYTTEEGINCFDVVLIDAGHTYEDVIADAIAYGHLATKYILFHDIQLPAVRAAYEWYLKQNPQFKHYEFINSQTFGYGIIEVA